IYGAPRVRGGKRRRGRSHDRGCGQRSSVGRSGDSQAAFPLGWRRAGADPDDATGEYGVERSVRIATTRAVLRDAATMVHRGRSPSNRYRRIRVKLSRTIFAIRLRMPRLPTETRWIIVGGGFAGAATAWALGGAGCGPGVILEQEIACGTHASGRNAALARLFEPDPVIGALARRSIPRLRGFQCPEGPLVRTVGGLTLAGPHGAAAVAPGYDAM